MSSPANLRTRYAALYDWAGQTISHKLRYRFHPETSILLDVGAGWGKYRDLFPDYTMDACEIWEPYIWNEMLEARYRIVHKGDICKVAKADIKYDAIIMGDVFEHIERSRAKELLYDLRDKCEEIYIVVPYMYPQSTVDNNPYEEHLQSDLTAELMETEYPTLQMVDTNELKGLYSWRK
jgi:hypothetical protein